MSSNKEKDIQLLIRTIRPELCRFIFIEYDFFPAISAIETILSDAYPDRNISRLQVLEKDYRQIIDSIYHQEKGIIFIEDFENLLAVPEKYIPFNQRRDKLAQYPIAIIAFMPEGYGHIQNCMKYIADIWSFRSLVLKWSYTKIEQHFDAKGISNFILYNYSELSVLDIEKQEKEIERLQKQLAETEIKPENLALIDMIYLNLLHLLISLNKNKECLQIARDFLNIVKKYKYDQIKPIIYAEALECLANVELKANLNFNLALTYYHQVLTIRKKELGEKSSDVAAIYHNISNLYYDKKDYKKALSFCEKAITIREKLLYKDSLYVTYSYYLMAHIYFSLQKYPLSLEYMLKVIKIREEKLPNNHHLLAMPYHNIASIYSFLSDYHQAIYYQSLALEIAQKSFPKNHPDRILIEKNYQAYLF